MNHGPAYIQEQARVAAERLLQHAATYIESLAPKPLFKKRISKGANSVFAQLDSFGVLSVIDSETGQVLAVSLPGKHTVLSRDFAPFVPALAGTKSGGD